MRRFDYLLDILYIIYPEFYTVFDDKGNELVFLIQSEERMDGVILPNRFGMDKTGLEAFENHLHIFDNEKSKDFASVKIIANKIYENLIMMLKVKFPQKHFFIYLTIEYGDSVTLRFHQDWPGEPEYLDNELIENEKSGKKEIYKRYI